MTAGETERGGWSIRQAIESDCAGLTNLMLRSQAYQGPYQSIIASYPVTPKMVEEGEVWVIELGSKVAGFYRLNIADADLDLMFVDDAAQGMGIGQAMFDHMRGIAAHAGLAEVTIVSHPPATEFYRRMGAFDVGVSLGKPGVGWDRPILKIATKS